MTASTLHLPVKHMNHATSLPLCVGLLVALFFTCLYVPSTSAQGVRKDLEEALRTIPGKIVPFKDDPNAPVIPREIISPLRLYSGLDVQERFNGYFDYERDYAPEASEDCSPRYMPNACGHVFWGAREQPPLDVVFTASVPSIIRLDGPKGDVWWAPYVHCMIVDEMKRRYSASLPGTHCDTRLSRDGEEMEWTLGGFAEGIHADVPGTYRGMIPMTVMGASYRWEVDIPVTYIVHETMSTCSISGPADKEFADVARPGVGEDDVPRRVDFEITITSSSGDEPYELDMSCSTEDEGSRDCDIPGLNFGGIPTEFDEYPPGSDLYPVNAWATALVTHEDEARVYTDTITITVRCR